MARDFLADASFFWMLREQGLLAPDYSLQELQAGPEQRLLACLDALLLGGPRVTRELLLPALSSDEPEQVACAASVLMSQPGQEHLDAVLSTLADEGGANPSSQGAAWALELHPSPRAVPQLLALFDQGTPTVQARVLDILTAWGTAPSRSLDEAITSRDTALAQAGLRAARRFPSRLERAALQRALESSDVEVRNTALETALRLGHASAWARCVDAVRRKDAGWGPPAALLAMGGDPQDLDLLLKALEEPALRKEALWALGLSGRVAAVGPLLEAMKDESVAQVAAEAFCAITGLVLTGPFVSEAEPRSPDASDEDAPPLSPEHDLPVPAPEAVAHWWQQAQKDFSPQVRYLGGKPFGAEALLDALMTGPMRRRAALALELAIRSQGAFQLRVRDWGPRQWKTLQAAKASLHGRLPLGPFRAFSLPAVLTDESPVQADALFQRVVWQRPPPPGALAITGLGMVSSLGDGVVGSCAAARVGVGRPGALEDFTFVDEDSGEELPVTGHAIPHLTQGYSGVGRLVRLGAIALADLQHHSGMQPGPRTGIFLNLPSGFLLEAAERQARAAASEATESDGEAEDADTSAELDETPLLAETLRERYAQTLLPRLLAQAAVPGSVTQQAVFFGDSPGFVTALRAAERALRSGALDRCIVGGIDSIVEPEWLDALDALRMLKTRERPTGLMPGEGAAFVLLESADAASRRGTPAVAYIDAMAASSEPGHLFAGKPHVGMALSSVIAEVLGSLEDRGQTTGLVIADLDGTVPRAQDWGYAQIRLNSAPLKEAVTWYPADVWGGLGAATGAFAVCMAARGFTRGYVPTSGVLTWLWGWNGERAAFHLRPPSAR
ncbi:TIGR02270 family protein [Myxococcus sp. Y35]|uniref:TIGR02270 family protein n=1 Tax=Pseudomyxococcus flavus TaxID=3115648 RepID=UPI003CF950D9